MIDIIGELLKIIYKLYEVSREVTKWEKIIYLK